MTADEAFAKCLQFCRDRVKAHSRRRTKNTLMTDAEYDSLGAQGFIEERSYFCGRLGEKAFDEKITLVDDGLDARNFPKSFDFEGTLRCQYFLDYLQSCAQKLPARVDLFDLCPRDALNQNAYPAVRELQHLQHCRHGADVIHVLGRRLVLRGRLLRDGLPSVRYVLSLS